MSDELAKNYEIFEINDPAYRFLVLRRFCHSSSQQWESITAELNQKNYKGWVLLDNLFKGGNTSFRYVRQDLDKTFSGPAFKVDIDRSHPYRQMISAYLKEHNYVVGTSLTDADIEAVIAGETI